MHCSMQHAAGVEWPESDCLQSVSLPVAAFAARHQIARQISSSQQHQTLTSALDTAPICQQWCAVFVFAICITMLLSLVCWNVRAYVRWDWVRCCRQPFLLVDLQRGLCRSSANDKRMQVLTGVFSMHSLLITGMLLWSAALPVRHISNDEAQTRRLQQSCPQWLPA